MNLFVREKFMDACPEALAVHIKRKLFVTRERVAIDIIGSNNPSSKEGHRFILTFVEYATRYAEAVPLQKIDAETVAEMEIYSRLGVPKEMLSDSRTQFMSDYMREVCRRLGIKQKMTTPSHPT
ncbi:Pol polyprotein [Plakobranchus ocellatus]|uniref:Pol polyprotein n=1 Tax=Plakobranchus ocellatus TaxID=259542 RepID=A0AAV4BDY7_9GAST|nr:Pol polyprotein [Plakobranchus ocellatus]